MKVSWLQIPQVTLTIRRRKLKLVYCNRPWNIMGRCIYEIVTRWRLTLFEFIVMYISQYFLLPNTQATSCLCCRRPQWTKNHVEFLWRLRCNINGRLRLTLKDYSWFPKDAKTRNVLIFDLLTFPSVFLQFSLRNLPHPNLPTESNRRKHDSGHSYRRRIHHYHHPHIVPHHNKPTQFHISIFASLTIRCVQAGESNDHWAGPHVLHSRKLYL